VRAPQVVRLWIVAPLAVVVVAGSGRDPAASRSGATPLAIAGIVRDARGPVADAVVRIQTTPRLTTTRADGTFTLSGVDRRRPVALSAFASGYYIAGPVMARPGDVDVALTLVTHTTDDHPDYQWLAASGPRGRRHCGECHSNPAAPASMLPFDEWRRDAHGTAALSRRFLSMYNGTDLSGQRRSPPTQHAFRADYGRFPLRPDATREYFGPGFKLDAPDSAGNCAACHAPAAAANAPYSTDVNRVTGAGREGVTCDICHKVWSVTLDPSTGLPYANRPGVLSLEFRRPAPDRQLFIGPFDDAAPGDDTFSPVQTRSQLCAPCHIGESWGVQIYDSFGEWLRSEYGHPVRGRTCQECHMPRRGATRVAPKAMGGRERAPATIFSHRMPGASDIDLLRAAARLDLTAARAEDTLRVDVRVTNATAGHHIPTDYPARNVLLVVEATDATGSPLRHLGSQIIPSWGGVGSDPDDFGGRPGKGYAKILEDLWTGVNPTTAFWQPTVVRADTRIPAGSTDATHYVFEVPRGAGDVVVNATLIYRRAFKELLAQKRWAVPDIVMAASRITLRSSSRTSGSE
jgi:mono/diheme cytochrome c family protein